MAEHRITKTTGGLMMSVALVIDGIQLLVGLLHFIPAIGNAIAAIINIIISFFAAGLFLLWFRIKGVKVIFGKKMGTKMASTIVSLIIEMIPVVKLLPGWTFWVWRMLVISRVQETKIVQTANPQRSLRRRVRRKGPRQTRTPRRRNQRTKDKEQLN